MFRGRKDGNESAGMIPCTYLVPLRRWQRSDIGELAGYLNAVAAEAEVIVADGSVPELFAAHRAALGASVRHIAVAPGARPNVNGKVRGVHAGVFAASQECVVIADDDVRYGTKELRRVVELLEHADLVLPQNYFRPAPWHALWDTARTLLNRVTGGDWPGTLALRRSAFLRQGGYADDVLFENLELVRAIRSRGGRVVRDDSLYVRRLPPTVRHFVDQRVRQAYDEFARPWRLLAFLAILPLLVLLLVYGGWGIAIVAALGALACAEAGRRRCGGASVFPASATLFAPLWILERGICSWFALGAWLSGGINYAGAKLRRAATPASSRVAIR